MSIKNSSAVASTHRAKCGNIFARMGRSETRQFCQVGKCFIIIAHDEIWIRNVIGTGPAINGSCNEMQLNEVTICGALQQQKSINSLLEGEETKCEAVGFLSAKVEWIQLSRQWQAKIFQMDNFPLKKYQENAALDCDWKSSKADHRRIFIAAAIKKSKMIRFTLLFRIQQPETIH